MKTMDNNQLHREFDKIGYDWVDDGEPRGPARDVEQVNRSDELELLYWGTAGCGSRSVRQFLAWIDVGFGESVTKSLTHSQGVPKGTENYKIICATRNPYTIIFSAWTDLQIEAGFTFEEYIKSPSCRYSGLDGPGRVDIDTFYWKEWPAINRIPEYLIRLECMEEDLKQITKITDIVDKELWELAADHLLRNNAYANESASGLDNYNSDRQQRVTSYYTQELADIVYQKEKYIFDFVGYDKDSWKFLE